MVNNGTVLQMVKYDLGLSSTARDEYLKGLISGCESELKRKFELDTQNTEDMMLLSDFAAWRYRNRISGNAMPENLTYRIRNRTIRGRVMDGTVPR